MIDVAGLTKKFGRHLAVDRLSFTVGSGCILGILGPNGSGKTTTVRMLCGLLLPDSGVIHIHGMSMVDDPISAKAVLGVLPDGSALFPHLTLWEHLIMEARVRGLTALEASSRAEDLLRFTDLWEKRNLPVHACSVGMRKKLGIALALIHKPPVVILDEPFDGLDPVSARKIRNLLQTMVRRCGTTLVVTSHVLTLVETLVNQVIIVGEGRLLRTLVAPQNADRSLLDTYLEAFAHDDALEVAFPWLA